MVVERGLYLVLAHMKSWYRLSVLRLLSSDVHSDDSIEAAFSSEFIEETGHNLNPSNFPALHRRQFHHADEQFTFDSCIIKTTSPDRDPNLDYSDEAILSFRWIPLCDFRNIAKELHSTPPTRTAWGGL